MTIQTGSGVFLKMSFVASTAFKLFMGRLLTNLQINKIRVSLIYQVVKTETFMNLRGRGENPWPFFFLP